MTPKRKIAGAVSGSPTYPGLTADVAGIFAHGDSPIHDTTQLTGIDHAGPPTPMQDPPPITGSASPIHDTHPLAMDSSGIGEGHSGAASPMHDTHPLKLRMLQHMMAQAHALRAGGM